MNVNTMGKRLLLVCCAMTGQVALGALIHDFVSRGDFAGMKRAVARGANINQQNELGRTPLFLAVMYGNTQMADYLISHGADKSIRDKNGFSPLYLALYFGDNAMAEKLLAQGAYSAGGEVPQLQVIGETNIYGGAPKQAYIGDTILILMIKNKMKPELIKQFIDDDSLERKGNSGMTPLMHAVVNLDPAFVMQHFARATRTVQDNSGRTALMLAAERGNPEIVRWLALGGTSGVWMTDYEGKSAADYALKAGRTELADYLRKLRAQYVS